MKEVKMGVAYMRVEIQRLNELKPGDLILVAETDPQNFIDEDDPQRTIYWFDEVLIVNEKQLDVRYDGPTDALVTCGSNAPPNNPIYEEPDFSFSAAGGYHPVKIWKLTEF